MIERYTRPEMGALWTDERKYRTWLAVELAACEAMSRAGRIPRKDWNLIRRRAAFDPKRIRKIEADVRHDVIAFLTNVAEHVGPAARHVHKGLTSSDVVDTALSVNLVKAADLLIAGVEAHIDYPDEIGEAEATEGLAQGLAALAATLNEADLPDTTVTDAGWVVIEGATSSAYTLVEADKGAKLTVKVTGNKTGYLSVSKTSKETTAG